MDIITKGTLIRACFALIWAAGFVVFLIPVFVGIFNIGNAAGMFVCGAMSLLYAFWGKVFPFISAHKPLKIICIIIAAIAVALIILAGIISAFMAKAMNNAPTGGETVIVLGCKVRGENPSLMLKKRIMAAKLYLEQNPSAVCIASGGQGSDELISEAECIKRVLVENGIDGDRIILEDRSTSTDENIRFSIEKMRENGIESGTAAVATSGFHQLRTGMIAKKYGLEVRAVSAKTAWYLIPTYWVREWFGVTFQFIKGCTE